MRTRREKAIVLKRVNYGEADRIIDFITPGGRVSAIAKGSRKQKSKLAGGVEPFSLCDVVFGDGKTDLKVVTSARMETHYNEILKDYDRMQFGYEVLAHVARASGGFDESNWFDMTRETLECLNDFGISLDLTRVWFYVRIADLLGEALNLAIDSDGDRLTEGARYRYDFTEKVLVKDSKGAIASSHIKILRLAANSQLRSLARVTGVDLELGECLYVARMHASLPKVL